MPGSTHDLVSLMMSPGVGIPIIPVDRIARSHQSHDSQGKEPHVLNSQVELLMMSAQEVWYVMLDVLKTCPGPHRSTAHWRDPPRVTSSFPRLHVSACAPDEQLAAPIGQLWQYPTESKAERVVSLLQ